jgi:hypothetical protein
MTALSILHDSRRRANYLKLSAYFLNLLGLLLELGCESLYLFLLLRDRCLQLLNFVTEPGLALERLERGGLGKRGALGARGRLRCATTPRCATRGYARSSLVRANIPAKVVVSKVKSNFNNVAANRLEVIEDTTDEAG